MAMHLDLMERERVLCVCVCAELVRMNMHKQLYEEWSLNVCACVRAVCFIKKEQRQEKSHTRTRTHSQTNAAMHDEEDV